jgi:hypothetical protein
MAISRTPTGSLKSIRERTALLPVISAGRRMSAVTTMVLSFFASSACPCARTIGSMSTYATRASGTSRCATSCVLPAVGSPAPMSMNCRMPAAVMNRTARRRKARFSLASWRTPGMAFSTASTAARSAG